MATSIERRQYSISSPEHTSVPAWMNRLKHKMRARRLDGRTVASHMCNNTPLETGEISLGRSLSAYFSLQLPNRENEVQGEVLVEAGQIMNDGTAKLHDYLNRQIDYPSRVSSGYHLVSGHLGLVGEGEIALLDPVIEGLPQNQTFNLLVSTLIANNIFPIGGDGVPVLLRTK